MSAALIYRQSVPVSAKNPHRYVPSYTAPASTDVAALAKKLLLEQGYDSRDGLVDRLQESSVDIARWAGTTGSEVADLEAEADAYEAKAKEARAKAAALRIETDCAYQTAGLHAATAVFLARGIALQ